MISSISKDHFQYLFKSDPEKKFYFAQKLDDIKNEYIKGGIFALNLELRHSQLYDNIFIKNSEEILKKSKIFLQKSAWSSSSFGGQVWYVIVEKIYELSQFPDLMDYVLQNPSDEALIHQIYNLIFKIDHINDICHNNGIALPKMLNEYYKSSIKTENDNLKINNKEEYLSTKYKLFTEITDFLDFKKEHDVKNLLLRRENIDKNLLESLEKKRENST